MRIHGPVLMRIRIGTPICFFGSTIDSSLYRAFLFEANSDPNSAHLGADLDYNFHVEASGSCLDPAFHCDVNPDQVIKLFAPVQFTSICQYDIRLFCADPDSFLKSCPFHADPDCNCCVGLTSAMYPL